MKKTSIILLFVAISAFCKANTDSLPNYELDATDELLYQSYLEANPLQAKQSQRANFLKDAWRFMTAPFRPVWGEYSEGGNTNHNKIYTFV